MMMITDVLILAALLSTAATSMLNSANAVALEALRVEDEARSVQNEAIRVS